MKIFARIRKKKMRIRNPGLIISIQRFADVNVRQIRVVEERGAGEGVGVDEGVPAGERRRG